MAFTLAFEQQNAPACMSTAPTNTLVNVQSWYVTRERQAAHLGMVSGSGGSVKPLLGWLLIRRRNRRGSAQARVACPPTSPALGHVLVRPTEQGCGGAALPIRLPPPRTRAGPGCLAESRSMGWGCVAFTATNALGALVCNARLVAISMCVGRMVGARQSKSIRRSAQSVR